MRRFATSCGYGLLGAVSIITSRLFFQEVHPVFDASFCHKLRLWFTWGCVYNYFSSVFQEVHPVFDASFCDKLRLWFTWGCVYNYFSSVFQEVCPVFDASFCDKLWLWFTWGSVYFSSVFQEVHPVFNVSFCHKLRLWLRHPHAGLSLGTEQLGPAKGDDSGETASLPSLLHLRLLKHHGK
jgi:hypothetical protein